jgi:hypothetical protein
MRPLFQRIFQALTLEEYVACIVKQLHQNGKEYINYFE